MLAMVGFLMFAALVCVGRALLAPDRAKGLAAALEDAGLTPERYVRAVWIETAAYLLPMVVATGVSYAVFPDVVHGDPAHEWPAALLFLLVMAIAHSALARLNVVSSGLADLRNFQRSLNSIGARRA